VGKPVCRLRGNVMLTLIFEQENVRTWSAYKQLSVASLAAIIMSSTLPHYLIRFVKVLSHKL
jgi:hypothetical protein